MNQDSFFLILNGGVVVAKLPNNGTTPLVTHSPGEPGNTPITTVLYEYGGRLKHQSTSFRLSALGTVRQVRESEELAKKLFPSHTERAVELMEGLVEEQHLEDHYLVLYRE